MKKALILVMTTLISTQLLAVHLSKDGTGQVLLFPYYTVNSDFNTLVNLTNTTDEAKALRIRFREAANAREVFQFNLYMGPNDVWTGALIVDDGITKIISNDNTCTYPPIAGESYSFYSINYQNDMADAYGEDNKRLREGFIEVIEMGKITGDSAAGTILLDGESIDACSQINEAWNSNGNNPYWINDPNTDISAPTGGITGNILLIDVLQGIAISEPATALDDFSDVALHNAFDNESPSLADSKTSATIVDSSGKMITINWGTGIQALSSVLTASTLKNEFVITDSIGASTDWITTMPTRQFHLDPVFAVDQVPVTPFATSIENDVNCQVFGSDKIFNRESQNSYIGTGGGIIIGTPPPPDQFQDTLCYAVNSLSFHWQENEEFTPFLESAYPIKRYYANGSNEDYFYSLPYDTGFADISFTSSVTSSLYINREIEIYGLPVIGFAVQNYVNASAQPGVLANYAGLFAHKKSLDINYHSSQATTQGTQSADLMQIADDNIGQVLLYPYYTVTNDINTLISVVNPTQEVKALSVRFLEGKNNRLCMSFNIYINAFDVWTAALVASSSTIPGHENQNSVKLLTNDKSCVVPNYISITGAEFLPFNFSDSYADFMGDDLQRCTEGHIEIIDMGQLIGNDAIAAMHNEDGVPSNCLALEQNWNGDTGKWLIDSTENVIPSVAGIYGNISLIDVFSGIDMSYEPTAIKNFSSEVIHSLPGSLSLNLSSGNNMSTLIHSQDNVYEIIWNSTIDAVSSLFMQSTVSNDFVTTDSIGAATTWVNLYPTKQFYVDPIYNQEVPLPPFSGNLSSSGSCDEVDFRAFNREQKNNVVSEDGVILPGVSPPGFELVMPHQCWALNVEKVSTTETNNNSIIFDSHLSNDLPEGTFEYFPISQLPFSEGTMHLNFSSDSSKIIGKNSNNEPVALYGKPVIGFVAQKYVNGSIGGNQSTLANYAIVNINKGKRKIALEASN